MPLRDEEVRKEFLKETRGNIKELELCIDKLNKKPDDLDIKKIALRLTHTLEGDALMAKRYDLAYFASKLTRLVESNEIEYAKSMLDSIENLLKEIKTNKKGREPKKIIDKLRETEDKKREKVRKE
ncbi:hypothetical protein CL616_04295 [archaeon]|nr:hypothetical protein [archaeon]|tara:strand:+ start:53 stop:430 length:378 start_codon:yes stop_codon:yes gene_type:complete